MTYILRKYRKNKIILTDLGSLIAFGLFLVILACCVWLYFTQIGDERPQRVFSTAEKVRFERLLLKHGLHGKVSVVEVRQDGKLFFLRNGERCELR
jgi:hypothetical protein